MKPETIKRSDFPPDWWVMPKVVRRLGETFQNYFAGIGVFVQDGDTPQEYVYSGFLLSSRGNDYWVTAKHVLESILCVLGHNWSQLQLRLIDCPHVACDESIPIDEDFIRSGTVVSVPGADVATIRLPQLYGRLLRENQKVRFFKIADIRSSDHPRIEGLYVIGAPEKQLVTSRDLRNGQIAQVRTSFYVTVLPIHPVPIGTAAEVLPVSPEFQAANAICGKLVYSPSEGIVGMSGGAIVGISRGRTKLNYYLCGVQGSWFEREGVILATRIEHLMESLRLEH